MYFSIHFIRIIALLLLLSLSPASMQAQQWDNYRSNLHNRNVKIDSSNLPIVFINVKGKVIQRDRYVLARMKIIHNGDGNTNYGDTLAYPNQTTDYEGWIALKSVVTPHSTRQTRSLSLSVPWPVIHCPIMVAQRKR